MKVNGFVSGVALICALTVPSLAGGDGWLTSLEAAKTEAVKRQVPILVDFSGSDWCGWCIKLDKEVFSKEEFKAYAKTDLVLLLVDFPRKSKLPEDVKKQNDLLAEKFDVQGFPTVLLLNGQGKELARTGYMPGGAEAYVKHVKSLVGKK
ncbi:MAG: thioredoxin family protein [bacterium]